MPADPGRDLEARPLRLARWAMGAVLAAVGAAALLLALTVPYHATDALVYGSWSVRIADTGTLGFPDLPNSYLNRPLFLVTQGLLWNVFGLHEWIGRTLSLAFGLVLVGSVLALARDHVPALLAAVVLLAIPEFAQNALSGMTDVPAAALTALAGAVLWTRREGAGRAAALVLLAAGAVLAKAVILPAVVGLGLAHLIGPLPTLRRRVLWGCVPLAVGVLVALAYDATQAARLDQDLFTFLTGGNAADPNLATTVDLNNQINEQGRLSVVLGMEWLGPYLVLPLLFSLIYAASRLLSAGHRRAATLAAPAAVGASVVLPWIASEAGDATVGPLDPSRPAAMVITLALMVPFWLSRYAPEAEAPSRANLARLLVWSAPTLLAWQEVAPYAPRYVAGVWAPLAVLVAIGIWMASRGTVVRLEAGRLSRHAAAAGAAVLALALLTAVVDLRNFDALGARPDGSIDAARFVSDIGATGWFDAEKARSAADPQLGGMLAATRRAAGPDGSVVTNDGRYIFFFSGRVRVGPPPSCVQAERHSAVALLLNVLSPLAPGRFDRLSTATQDVVRRGLPEPARLARCSRLRKEADVPGSFAVWSVAGTRSGAR